MQKKQGGSLRRRKWWVYALLILLVALLTEIILFISVVVTAKKMDNPQPADTMIVLGAGINMEGQPKSTLQYRLDRAIELYEQGYAPAIIMTGAQGDDEPMPEAYAMRDYAVERGVPDNAVFCDPNSYNTKENLQNAKAIMEENGMATALVVTSDYHVWRTLQLAGDLDIEAAGAGARNAKTWRYAVRNCMRETLSWIKYALTRQGFPTP